jgi:hypothetical protein
MRDVRNVDRILVGKPERTRPLGRPKNGWKDGNRMYHKAAGSKSVDRINFNQDRGHWRALVTLH